MSALAREFAGTGAMLARLVQLGARCGLTAEATLVHVLDGAPIPEGAGTPSSIAEILERVRSAADASPSALPQPEPEAAASDPEFTEAAKEALGAVLKRDRVLGLYAATAWRRPRIAKLAGTTLQGATFFLKEARAKGDPRVVAGDAARGGPPRGPAANAGNDDLTNSPETAIEAPMAVDGVGADCSTELPSQSDNILPTGSNGESGRADSVPDVSPEGAHEGRGFESRRDDDGAPSSTRSAAVAQAGRVAPSPQVSPETAAEAPMAVYGVGAYCSTEHPSQSDNILPAGNLEEGGRADLAPDVSPERAEDDLADEGLCFEYPEAAPGFDQHRLDTLNDQSFATELGAEYPADEATQSAERDPGSPDLGGSVAAIPAPPAVQEDEPEKGEVSQQQPALDPPEAADTAARPAGPGQECADANDHVAAAGEVVPGSAREEAGDAIPPVEPASSPIASPDPAPQASDDNLPMDSAARVLTLFRDTEATLGEIAQRAGITNRQAGAIIASGRRRGDRRVAAGDLARERKAAANAPPPVNEASAAPGPVEEETATGTILRLWKETLKGVTEIAAEVGWAVNKTAAVLSTKRKRGNPNVLAGDAARSSANARRAEEPRQPQSPPREEGPPDDLALLRAGDVLAIDRGWIVGPLDVRKGFSLINSVLALLGKGDPIDADEIARECGVRSGGAVLKQLDHWKADLAAIGVDIIRLGGAVVRIRRAS